MILLPWDPNVKNDRQKKPPHDNLILPVYVSHSTYSVHKKRQRTLKMKIKFSFYMCAFFVQYQHILTEVQKCPVNMVLISLEHWHFPFIHTQTNHMLKTFEHETKIPNHFKYWMITRLAVPLTSQKMGKNNSIWLAKLVYGGQFGAKQVSTCDSGFCRCRK